MYIIDRNADDYTYHTYVINVIYIHLLYDIRLPQVYNIQNNKNNSNFCRFAGR